MSDRDELFLKWELGLTTESDDAALAIHLTNSDARRDFVRHARIAAALGNATPQAETALPVVAIDTPTAQLTRTRPVTKRTRNPNLRRSQPTAYAPFWAMAAGILLCIGVAFLSFLALSKLTPPSGTLAQLTTNGAAIIYDINGNQRPALPHDVITTGETVAATMGDAVIVLEHQMAEMTLRAGSQLRFPANIGDPKNVALLFHLEQGRIRADVAPRTATTPFKISSPIASVEVIGTQFEFGFDTAQAHLSVDHGAVHLSTPTDNGVIVKTGRAGLVSDGFATVLPPAFTNDQPLPTGSTVLFTANTTNTIDWRGLIYEQSNNKTTWQSVAPRPRDPWSCAEIRSPILREGWPVGKTTWLRFYYHAERFSPKLHFNVHVKPKDETNYEHRLAVDPSDGWHQAVIRIDTSFFHVERQTAIPVNEKMYGIVWTVTRNEGDAFTPTRFWIRDAAVYVVP